MLKKPSVPEGETWAEVTRRVAQLYGFDTLSDEQVERLLWEETSFPVWVSSGVQECEDQLKRFFQSCPKLPA